MNFPPVAEQLALIRRGVEKIVPEEELTQKLEASRASGKPLRIKYGIDPTGIDLHLGHTVPLRKMRQFQELGHQAVIIIGNYTAMVGDPSGRDETRARLSEVAVEQNAKTYLEQVGRVIDLDHAEVHRNGDWFGKMNFSEILTMCSKVTIAQLLTRDDFSKRMKDESPIYLHECLYPLMQAWDSVEIKADVELGGTEQLYSFMLARDLQKDAGLNQQIGIMSPILVGLDGVRRMGKSLGNYIGIAEAPIDIHKKIMSIPDHCLKHYFELLTDEPIDQVEKWISENPKGAKHALGGLIVEQYHPNSNIEIRMTDEEAIKYIATANVLPVELRLKVNPVVAVATVEQWEKEVAKKEMPFDIANVDIPLSEISIGAEQIDLFPGYNLEPCEGTTYSLRHPDTKNPLGDAVELLVAVGLCNSRSEAKKLVAQGGVSIGENRTVVKDPFEKIEIPPSGLLLWRGKKGKQVVRIFAKE